MGVQDSASFGARLRRLREEAGLTQEELAQRAGLTRKGIGALERGERQRPYPHTVRALGAALGLSPDDMAALIETVPRRALPPAAGAADSVESLPIPVSTIVGRDVELGGIVDALMRGERLLTLTGPGGVGKTRLAIEAGHRLSGLATGEVVFVPLAPVVDATLVPHAIGEALGLREAADRTPREVLLAALRSRPVLLILDNAEHLTAASSFLAELLEVCPGTRLLVTSRWPLRLRGERELPVRPLPLPDRAAGHDPETLAASPAVQLFVQRAAAVTPDFALTPETSAAVAAICVRLDGLPLAIELAAPRLRLLAPEQLLAHLDRLLPALSDGARDLPARQRTMQATVQWSHDLLDASERGLFRRLSVFSGGWTLDTAQAMAPEADMVTLLGGLVEQSLVIATPDRRRFRMLEPIREYAAEALASAADHAHTHRIHATTFLALAETAAPALDADDQLTLLERLDAEHDNLRAALRWLLDTADPAADLPVRLVAALSRYWYLRGHWTEGRTWIDTALAQPGADGSPARGQALREAGLIALFQNDYRQATGYLREGLAHARARGDLDGAITALTRLGFVAAFERDTEAIAAVRAEIDALPPPVPGSSTDGYLRIFLGLEAVMQGDLAAGVARHRESLEVFRSACHMHGMVWSLTNLGLLELISGAPTAEGVLRENLKLATRLGEPASIHYALLGLATVAIQRDDATLAARLWGVAERVRADAGMEMSPLARAQTQYEAWVTRTRNALGDDCFASAWAQGRAMTLEAATALVEAHAPPT